MITTRFQIIKHQGFKNDKNRGYFNDYTLNFIIKGTDPKRIFREAERFYEEFQNNTNLHIKTLCDDVYYELRILNYDGGYEENGRT